MSQFSGPFSGDVKPVPSPTSESNKINLPGGLTTTEDTSVLKTVTQMPLSHGPSPLDSPFQNDFRPGVNSSK